MAKPRRQYRGSGEPDLYRRIAMEELLRAGYSLRAVACLLNYANAQSAAVMAHRWGLHTLRRESFYFRARRHRFKTENGAR